MPFFGEAMTVDCQKSVRQTDVDRFCTCEGGGEMREKRALSRNDVTVYPPRDLDSDSLGFHRSRAPHHRTSY
jgi:hypothetical protein